MNEIDEILWKDYIEQEALFLQQTPEETVEFYKSLPGSYTLTEVMMWGWKEFPHIRNSIRRELEYNPPWISEDLMEYSLKGIDAIKV